MRDGIKGARIVLDMEQILKLPTTVSVFLCQFTILVFFICMVMPFPIKAQPPSFQTTGTAKLRKSGQMWRDTHPLLLEILFSDARPSVSQIEELIGQNGLHLKLPPQVEHSSKNKFNYPLWFQQLENGIPKMIAEFEYTFPGATWAFIGRDTAIFADMFESFYRSLGQVDRVARINISTTSVTQDFTFEKGREILKEAGFNPILKKHAFILIDTVSSGGGRQGKALLNSFLSQDGIEPEIIYYLNFIGLRTPSSNVTHRPLYHAFSLLTRI